MPTAAPSPAKLTILAATVIYVPLLYFGLSCTVFEWRNPLANRMTTIREWRAVIGWQRLERYQPKD